MMDGVQSKLRATGVSTTGFSSKADAHHISSNGHYLGEINARQQGGDVVYGMTLKDQHFSSAPVGGSSMTQYQTQEGDTLKALALAFYGNADYWYLIASANGLTQNADEPLNAGLTLDIPARASSSNSHNSFKPLDMAKIIGDTMPEVPYVPPPPRAGCNAIAMVVMIAVTVVASVMTAGAAATVFCPMMSGFIGGVVGSTTGQLVGKALGVVESFSLKNALVSGITQGFAQGAASALKGADWAKDAGLVIEAGEKAGELSTYGKMALAATSVGVNVAANKAVGESTRVS